MTTTGVPPAVIFGVLLDRTLMAWPGRNQLMKSLAAHTNVVLLQRSDDQRLVAGLRGPRLEQLESGLWVLRDAFTLSTRRGARRLGPLAPAIDGWRMRRVLARSGLRTWIMWLTVAQRSLVQGVPDARLVFDCMDPNFLPDHQADFDRVELGLARRASVVFASAGTLYQRMRAVNHATYLLPNAASMPPDQPETQPAAVPSALRGSTGPVAGYLGTIDWRFDAASVTAAARALPHITFAIVGRVNADQEHRVAELRSLPNVVMPGQVSLSEGEAYTRAFDVGLIPFTPSEMNDAINPVKMYMYLAYGKPVVSTWISECRDNPWVLAARDTRDFAAAILDASGVQDSELVRQRIAFARANTWDARATTAIEILSRHNLWSGAA